ncbi:MAG: hypothetical protein LBT48_00030 [Prevotellaceae bacterium]|nr:hypothetical protein [Prevotellaceae bacterium]
MQGATKDSSTNVKELIKVLQTGEINGYKAEYNNNIGWYGGGWRISKKNDCHVYLFFGERRPEQPVSVSLSINEVKSSVWHGTPAMLYKCLDEFDSIEREFLVMLSKLEKLEKEQEKRKKIREITKNSAKTWIKELLKDSGYTYCIEEMDSKIALSVKMKNGTQLEIPIHYNRFQKIMPEVMNIIKEFERLLDEKGIKVLIVNARVKTKWTNK